MLRSNNGLLKTRGTSLSTLHLKDFCILKHCCIRSAVTQSNRSNDMQCCKRRSKKKNYTALCKKAIAHKPNDCLNQLTQLQSSAVTASSVYERLKRKLETFLWVFWHKFGLFLYINKSVLHTTSHGPP